MRLSRPLPLQVPFAVIDGIDMTQSIAIVRYVATTRGFLGKT